LFQELHNFLNTISAYPKWQVAIELLLIGTFVYSVIKFLQGTRGARMLKGASVVLIGLYLIVHLIGQRYDLTRIEFLYSRLLIITSFAMVVVFQPELRRALMRLGETRFFRSFSTEIHDDINALVESATFLSRRKIGALIAIEREDSLGAFSESGERLNADLSANLLDTIFWPNSPLHDLGVVISGGRIMYAGVQFPLAESGDLADRDLGSRHRAAVGLSQESDAVVIVCSEETGDISVAERGALIRKLTPDALRGLLSELLSAPDSNAAPKKKIATKTKDKSSLAAA
jgi:diadenylate cyclase